MNQEDARLLIEHIGVLRHQCDLDLLLFFARHPRTLLTSEQLAAWLGYELKRIADSLEVLMEAGLLIRTQNPIRAARLYVLTSGGTQGGWLPPLLESASTREGRLALMEAIGRGGSKDTGGPSSPGTPEMTAVLRPHPFVARRKPEPTRGTKAG